MTFAEANLHLFGSQGHASAALKNLHTSLHSGRIFCVSLVCHPHAQVFCLYKGQKRRVSKWLITKIYSLKT